MATTPKKDYYEILGVKKSASAEEIRKAFSPCCNRLSRKRHFRSPLLSQVFPAWIR